jgi:hypothetical protein
VKNLCVGALIEAVRDQTKTVDLKTGTMPCSCSPTGATTPATSPPSRSLPTTRRPNRNRPPPPVRRTLPARQLLTKHKRALRGRNPPRDSQNQRRPQESENKSGGMNRANARPCPLRFFHRLGRRSAGALCHASKILGSGATPRPAPNPHPAR